MKHMTLLLVFAMLAAMPANALDIPRKAKKPGRKHINIERKAPPKVKWKACHKQLRWVKANKWTAQDCDCLAGTKPILIAKTNKLGNDPKCECNNLAGTFVSGDQKPEEVCKVKAIKEDGEAWYTTVLKYISLIVVFFFVLLRLANNIVAVYQRRKNGELAVLDDNDALEIRGMIVVGIVDIVIIAIFSLYVSFLSTVCFITSLILLMIWANSRNKRRRANSTPATNGG